MQRITTDHKILQTTVGLTGEVLRSTMGPHPSNVTITKMADDQGRILHGRSINDGVQIVRALRSSDPLQALVYERIRRACEATLRETGDGTSSTVVLFDAIYSAMRDFAPDGGKQMADNVAEVVDRICSELATLADKEIDQETLRQVARIAMHGHPWADGVADLLFDLGLDGSFTIEVAKDGKFSTERHHGFRWGAGVASQQFFNLRGRFECNDAFVAVVAGEVADIGDISGVVSAYVQEHFTKDPANARPLVLVCQRIVGNALAALVRGQMPGTNVRVPFVVLNAPQVADQRSQMDDLAAVFGTVVYDKTVGMPASDMNITIADFGRAAKVVASDKLATLAPGEGSDADARVEALEQMLDGGGRPADELQMIRQRIANIRGSYGVIKLNIGTESEYQFLAETVEDGYRAVQSALRHGVLPGAGKALVYACNYVAQGVKDEVLFNIIDRISTAVSGSLNVSHQVVDLWDTVNLHTGISGPAKAIGVLDNAGSVTSSLRNACTEALLLANTKYFIVNE